MMMMNTTNYEEDMHQLHVPSIQIGHHTAPTPPPWPSSRAKRQRYLGRTGACRCGAVRLPIVGAGLRRSPCWPAAIGSFGRFWVAKEGEIRKWSRRNTSFLYLLQCSPTPLPRQCLRSLARPYPLRSLALAYPPSRFWPAATGLFERLSVVSTTRSREVGRHPPSQGQMR